MEFDSNSNTIINILNNVLKNINEDISFLRADFKKLNDLVIVLSVKVDETKSIKYELRQISSKVEAILSRIFELEKAKEKLEFLITQVDKDHKSSDTLSDMNVEKKIQEINARIKSYDDKLPILWKVLVVIFALLGIILYVTKSYSEAWFLIIKLFSFF